MVLMCSLSSEFLSALISCTFLSPPLVTNSRRAFASCGSTLANWLTTCFNMCGGASFNKGSRAGRWTHFWRMFFRAFLDWKINQGKKEINIWCCAFQDARLDHVRVKSSNCCFHREIWPMTRDTFSVFESRGIRNVFLWESPHPLPLEREGEIEAWITFVDIRVGFTSRYDPDIAHTREITTAKLKMLVC